MTRKKRNVIIGILSLVTCASTFVGKFVWAEAANDRASVAAQGVLAAENANATMQTHVSQDGKNVYRGVTVGNGGTNAYSGSFDGVFTGNLEIEYKFPGKSELSTLGDSMGSFTFRITSEKNTDQWFDIFIHSKYSGDTLKKDYYALETVLYGDYSMSTGKTIQEGLTYESYVWSGTDYANSSVCNAPTAMSKSTQAPKFHTDNSADTEKLSFEINEKTGFLSIWYYTGNDVSVKKKLVEFDGSMSYNIFQAFDTSEGYRISFESEMNVKGKTYYLDGIGDSDTATTEAKSTDVCFLSLNGCSLQENMLTVDVLDGAEKSYAVNGRTLSSTQKNVVELGSEATVYRHLDCILYQDKGQSFSFTSKTPVGELVTTDLGNYTKTVEGIQFAYSVGESKVGTSFANLSFDSGNATARYVNKTMYTVHNYDGTLVQSDTAYSGRFNEAFLGSTTIEYKFPGRSNVEHSLAARNGKGDALGNFYFKAVSIANPDEWFEIRIQPMVNADGTLSASKTTMKLITPWSKTEKKERVMVRCKYTGGIVGKDFAYPAELEQIDAWANDKYAAGPHFNTDLNDAGGDFAEKLYFDVDESGVMSVYYDMRGKGMYNSEQTFDNVGKYSWNASNATYSQPIVTFNGANEYFQFDLSQGYTISFGSDFDVNETYYDGKGKPVDLSSNGYGGIDGGTDIIFLSVGGLSFNQKEYAYVCEKEVGFDGQTVQNGDTLYVTESNINEPIVVKTAIYTNTDLTQVQERKFYWHKLDLTDCVLHIEGENFGEAFAFDFKIVYQNEEELFYTVRYKIGQSVTSQQYPITQRSVVLSEAEAEGKKFVGWHIKSLNGVYPKGYEYDILQDDTLTAVFTDFALSDGASIRLETPYGIRFFSNMAMSEYNALSIYVPKTDFSVGIIVTPTDLIVDGAFTHADCGSSSDFKDFKNLTAYDKAEEQLTGIYDSKYLYYTGMYIDISEEYMARAFSARAYLEIRYADGSADYVYSDYDQERNSRSPYAVALACKENGETGSIVDEYITKTANLTLTDTTKQTWSMEEEVRSVCVNEVWIAKEGSTVVIGEEEYLVSYVYDGKTKMLTLSYAVADS